MALITNVSKHNVTHTQSAYILRTSKQCFNKNDISTSNRWHLLCAGNLPLKFAELCYKKGRIEKNYHGYGACTSQILRNKTNKTLWSKRIACVQNSAESASHWPKQKNEVTQLPWGLFCFTLATDLLQYLTHSFAWIVLQILLRFSVVFEFVGSWEFVHGKWV